MAFGGFKGRLSLASASTAAGANSATGSVSVSNGDLVFVSIHERTQITNTGVTDNLGNSYSAASAGQDGGNPTIRVYYSVVTAAGTLTSVNSNGHSSSSSDIVVLADVYEGTFVATASVLDANVETTTADTTSPVACPASGVLAQADELVVGATAMVNGGNDYAGSNGFTLTSNIATGTGANTVGIATCNLVVSATTSVTPQFTTSLSITDNVLGTYSFKKAAGGASDNITVDKADITVAGKAVNEIHPAIEAATISVAGQAVNEIYPQVTAATISLAGQAVAETELVQVNSGAITLAGQSVTETEAVGAGTITVAGQQVLANDTELVSNATITLAGQAVTDSTAEIVTVDPATITLAGQDVPANDTELVSAGLITLAGQPVNEAIPFDAGQIVLSGQDVTVSDTGAADTTTVDPAQITLAGSAVAANDTETVDSATVLLAGQAVAANDTEAVASASVVLAGQAVAANDNEPIQAASVLLAGQAVSPTDTTVSDDTVTVSAGQVVLSGQDVTVADSGGGLCFILLEDGGKILLEDGSGGLLLEFCDAPPEPGGGACRHPRWPLYVEWHWKDKRWCRVYDYPCPDDIGEEIERELPYEAPLAPSVIAQRVGSLRALGPVEVQDDDSEFVALMVAMEDD